ncbi:MAG: hypothetical protein JXB39_16730 [Deltaproteobacteria bacterium]|nr:hypothetical protein [Deltaproteobacteria bacterium]
MASSDYIDLGRRFVDFDARDITTLTLRMLGSLADRVTVGWEDILRSRCAIILGEPGSGKTTETKAKVAGIRASGGHAFYRTVTDLRHGDPHLVSSLDQPAFEAWKASGAECVFVLDSLDEARDAGIALCEAIEQMVTDLAPEWERVRVVLTCRVAEWRPVEDLAALGPYFPDPKLAVVIEPDGSPTPIDSLGSRRRQRTAISDQSPPGIRVVRLAVLSEDQALTLARALGARKPDALREEVRRTAAWALLERPVDVSWLVAFWNRRGTIGRLTDLMEESVAARLEEHGLSRRRRAALSPERAARGARELALCGILCSERRVRVAGLDLAEADGSLSPSAALPWMSPREHAELTGRAIFVDDGPGTRRIHHRTTEDYLAAGALFDLLGRQPGGTALADFLVRERYGRLVVPPSLRGVAGWAAGWDPGLRRALLEADPLLLLETGDPAAIPPGERRGALTRILDEFERHPWRREGADHADLARFACPELCDLIRECLRGPARRGFELLLRLVWHGRLAANAEDALRLAAVRGTAPELRALAGRAAAAAGDAAVRERVVRLACGGRNPRTEVLFDVADELYPQSMTTTDLGAGLVAWATAATRTSRSEAYHWSWLLDREYDTRRHEELALIVGTALLRRARAIPARRSPAGMGAVRLASVLRSLLERRLRDGTPARPTLEVWAPWLWALARVHEASDSIGEVHRGVADLMAEAEVRRHTLRWLVRNRVPCGSTEPAQPFAIFRNEPHDLWQSRPGDLAWMVRELHAGKSARERAIWFGLACQACGSLDEAESVEAAAAAFPELAAEVTRWRDRRATTSDPREEEFRRHQAEIEAEHAERERRNREDLISLIEEVRSGTHDGALRFLVERMEDDRHSRWGHSDWRSLAGPFGADVAEAAREGLKRAWRRFRPMLPHERDKPNEVEWFVPVGLSGLNIAFADGLTPSDLSEEDAEQATAFALCEINDFPAWFGTLAEARPDEVLRVLAPTLEAEYAGTGASANRAVLDNLGYRDARVRRLATPTLLALLETQAPAEAHALERALAAVEAGDGHGRQLLALARSRAALDGDEVAAMWWRCLASLNARTAALILQEAAGRSAGQERLVEAVAAVDWNSAGLDAAVLVEIVRSTYRTVVPTADVHHPSGAIYSPGPRDEAERRRSGLVGSLADIPGEDAFRALLSLADDPATSAHHDRFAGLAHARCERDAEAAPLELRQARQFMDAPEVRFADADGFFDYALERLEDLRRTIEAGPFSCRTLLRTTDEPGVQLFVANVLRLTATRCSVVREEEVDQHKKPDIRLHSSQPLAVVGIEIKVADAWTLPQLVSALERQLVGQYLRDACSRHGVLLLVHSGAKRRWKDGDRKITFEAVVELLVERARNLAQQGGVRVRVVAIDCRDRSADGSG